MSCAASMADMASAGAPSRRGYYSTGVAEMNLIDIVKKLPWPDGAAVVVQDCTVDGAGVLKYCQTDLVAQIKRIDEQRSMRWAANECPVYWAESELADDHDEAAITHADWLEAQEDTMNTET